VSLPLLVTGQTLGIIVAGSSRGPIDAEQQRALGLVADEAAIAVENSRLYGSIRNQRRELRALSARLDEMENAEKLRLSRELHDQVGSNLTALAINLNILRDCVKGKASALARVEDSLKLTEETMECIRGIVSALRPPVLDDYGLPAALHWYGEQFSKRANVTLLVGVDEIEPRPPPEVERILFRIAQEALTNVARHSRATHVTLRLEASPRQINLMVADNGVGFEETSARDSAPRHGWGLISMRERAISVEGALEVRSRPGFGTQVIVRAPR
jgi:signal transduction histidine kinase